MLILTILFWTAVTLILLYLLLWAAVWIGCWFCKTLAQELRHLTSPGSFERGYLVPRQVPLIFWHWLPRLLHTPGITLFGFVLLRDRFLLLSTGKVYTADILVAHELIHAEEEANQKGGSPVWLIKNLWYLLTDGHTTSPIEQRARIQAPLLVAGTHPTLKADLSRFVTGRVTGT